MNNIDWEEIFMPSLQPKSIREQTGRRDAVDVLFKFVSTNTNKELALWCTHEEVVSPLLKNFILSYKDLPRYVYQIQNKFRDETRAKSWILRAREFLMKDLYSFHTSQEDLDAYYEKATTAYNNIYSRAWIWAQTYMTYASWWVFSKYSHEFQTLTDAWEDIIYICDQCHVAINKEIIEDQNTCPQCGNSNLRTDKAVEVWNIFKLWTKFSVPFDLSFIDKDNTKKPVIMWCYGIWLGRLMWTVVEVHHDEEGIKWPESIAPYKYVIIWIWKAWTPKAEEIYKTLSDQNIEVIIDDRDLSTGFKIKDANLMWFPYQIIVSDKTLENGENIVELTNRMTGEKNMIDYKTLK